MKHLFIINPAAGSRDRTKEYKEKITAACKGLDYEIAVSACPGDCTRLAKEAAETGQEVRIYACGGDGTLNEVAAGAAGYENAAITAFSGGSGNDFTKLFSDPDAFRDIRRLLDPEETTFDLIDCNGDLALNICCVGLDSRIGADVSNYKRLPCLSSFHGGQPFQKDLGALHRRSQRQGLRRRFHLRLRVQRQILRRRLQPRAGG